MRTVPPGWETDEDSIGFDTDDTQSIGSEWEVSSAPSSDGDSDMPEPSETSDGDSDTPDASDASDAESDCTAMPDEIPDEAFGFDAIEAQPALPPAPRVDLGEDDSFADQRLADKSNWAELWSQVSLDNTGPYGFLSDKTCTPASVAAYAAEDYVADVDIQPHLFAHCRSARTENRLNLMPNVETLRLFVQYTESGPTVHGPNERQLCPALCGFAPTAVVLRGMSLVFDDIPLEIWIPRVLDRMARLVLVLDPGPTGEQWRKHSTSNQPTEMTNAGIVSVLRALPRLDLTIVFNAGPGEVWDSGCNPVIINALGHLISNFAGRTTIVNLESVTSQLILERQLQVQNLSYLRDVRRSLNKTIFKRSTFSRRPLYLSVWSWMLRSPLSNKAIDSSPDQWTDGTNGPPSRVTTGGLSRKKKKKLKREAMTHQPHPPMTYVPPPTTETRDSGPPTGGPSSGRVAVGADEAGPSSRV